jgi:hypothetical protein
MKKADRSVQLLKTIRGVPPQTGLKIVVVDTTDPNPVTFIFEGTKLPLDLGVFEVPVNCYPLRKGDRLLAYPLIGEGASQRWGIVEKINSGVVLASMQSGTSLSVSGIDKVYGADDLVIPPYFLVGNTTGSDGDLVGSNGRPLQAGDTVSIAPTWDAAAKKIKYVILEKY